MPYAKGSSITASDFNNFAGITLTPAASIAAAQNKAGYLWGVGYGDRGYGETAPTLQNVSGTSNLVPALMWDWLTTSVDSWTSSGATITSSSGVLRLNSQTTDPILRSPTVAINGSVNMLITARIRRVSGNGWDGVIYYTTSGHGESESFTKVRGQQPNWDTSGWAIVEWDMSQLTSGGNDWITSTITSFRMDLGSTVADVFEIDWVMVGQKSATTFITPSEWLALRTTMINLATWQGAVTTVTDLIPPTTGYATGSNIVAYERDAPSLSAYDIQNVLASLDAGRFNRSAGSMTLTPAAVMTTRAATWGTGVGGITCEFSVTFASENAARYFFNTGGEIRVACSHPDTSTPRNTSWNTALSGFQCGFRANATLRLGGSFGIAQAVGYYQLTTTYQTIIDGTNTGVSPYTINDFYVDARATSIPGVNGARGAVIHFRVRLIDEQVGGSDIVNNGTVAQLAHVRATGGNITPKAAPTCALVTAF